MYLVVRPRAGGGNRRADARGVLHRRHPAEIVAATHAKLQSESARSASAIQRRPLRPAKISTPMRVIAAQHDLLSPADDQRELARDFNTDCHIIDGGHDLMLDTCWPQLADLLVQLIDDAPN